MKPDGDNEVIPKFRQSQQTMPISRHSWPKIWIMRRVHMTGLIHWYPDKAIRSSREPAIATKTTSPPVVGGVNQWCRWYDSYTTNHDYMHDQSSAGPQSTETLCMNSILLLTTQHSELTQEITRHELKIDDFLTVYIEIKSEEMYMAWFWIRWPDEGYEITRW